MPETTRTPASASASSIPRPAQAPAAVPQDGQEIRAQITRRADGICGLKVAEVNFTVDELDFDGVDNHDEQS